MKVFAKVRGIQRDPVKYEVEFAFLVGAARSDCAALVPGSYSNESALLFRLKAALVIHLNVAFAPETFSSSDVVLFG